MIRIYSIILKLTYIGTTSLTYYNNNKHIQ